MMNSNSSKFIAEILLTGLITLLFCSREPSSISGGSTDSGNARISATAMYNQSPAAFAFVKIRNTGFIAGEDRTGQTIIDTITDENGNFSLDINKGVFTVEIIKDDTLAVTSEITIDSTGAAFHPDTLTLQRTGSLAGKLQNGTYISGCVKISGYEHTAFIDESGSFTFPNLAQGDYTLVVEINGNNETVISDVPVQSGEISNIRDINTSDSNWTIIRPGTFAADSLAIREFLDNQNISVPYDFNEITDTSAGRIRTLDLRGLSLNSLHPSIGNLDFLYTLNISNNSISIIPEQIEECRLLSAFIAEHNSIDSIPPGISKLRFLEFLKVSYNNIRTIPDTIFFMPKLRKLSIGANPIDSLSPLIGNLRNLEQLDIFECNLSKIPEELGNLTRLNQIWAGHNRLTSLPQSITNLGMLEILQLSFNELTGLPQNIGDLVSLKNLSLYDNNLIDLPFSVLDLVQLQELSIEKNRLCNLEKEIADWVEKHTGDDWKNGQECE